MEPNGVKQKLLGVGFSIMEGVDPNPDNYVCASILYSRSQQVGCLCRLEPNAQAQVCMLLFDLDATQYVEKY